MKTLEDSNLHCHPKSRGASVPTGNGASSFGACDVAEASCPSGRRTWKQHPSGRKPPVGLPSEPRVCEKRTLSLHWMTWGSKALSLVGAEARAQLPTSACCSDPCASPPGLSLITLTTESSITALLKLPARNDQCSLNVPMSLRPTLLSYTIKIDYYENGKNISPHLMFRLIRHKIIF